jgi:cytochrome c
VKYEVAVKDLEDGDPAKDPEGFGYRTLVTASWSKAASGTPEVARGMALMKQSDCFNCHAAEQQVLGPALVEIAKKYRGQPGAVQTCRGPRDQGSSGVWGQLPMLPHPQHTADEVNMMVTWILSLEPGAGAPALLRGSSGEIVAPKDSDTGFGVLEASYTDLGREEAGPLTSKATLRVRSRRVEAEQADEVAGPQQMGGGSASGKKFIGAIADGHNLRFARLNLAGSPKVTCRLLPQVPAESSSSAPVQKRDRFSGAWKRSPPVAGSNGWSCPLR